MLVDKVTPDRHGDAAEPAATARHLANDRPLVGADVIALDRVVVAVPALLAAAHVDPAVDDGDAGPVATLVHGGAQLPSVGARIEAFDLVRVLRRRVPATCSVIRHTCKRQHITSLSTRASRLRHTYMYGKAASECTHIKFNASVSQDH